MRKTYFGIASLITGSLCIFSLLSNYGASYLNISRETFNLLNNVTALFYCALTQVTFVLGVIGLTRKDDSKKLSWVGIVLAGIPFLIVFGQFVYSLIPHN